MTFSNFQLLKLGYLLRVSGNDQKDREGRILQLVAECAVKGKHYKLALETCERLMAAGYAPIWTQCTDLAQQEDFRDIAAK